MPSHAVPKRTLSFRGAKDKATTELGFTHISGSRVHIMAELAPPARKNNPHTALLLRMDFCYCMILLI